MRPRMIAAGVLLVFGAAMLAYAISQFLSPDVDWMTVEAGSGQGGTCAGEFTFLYRPDSAAERRAVTQLYTGLCRTAYEQFNHLEPFEGVNNVYAINRHPNEALTVDRVLYDAFAQVVESGSRLLYLGPVYARYGNLFFCGDDSQLADFDPALSEEVAREYREIATFANDPEMIRLELLDGNQIRLVVAQEYLAYAERAEIEDFIDFDWTSNAFIADYLARELTAQGYTRGALTSYDGFIRNLDGSGRNYSLSLYDRREESIRAAAVLEYTGPMSAVILRDYPLGQLDALHYYELRSGEIRTPYLDPADGLNKNAVHNLVCYSGDSGCGEMALKIAPIYIADSLRVEALEHLAAEGIESIRFEDGMICPTDPGATLTHLYESDGVRYTLEK